MSDAVAEGIIITQAVSNLERQIKDRNSEIEGISQQIKNESNSSFNTDRILVDGLRAELQTNGWEPLTEKGENWYSYSFRRQIK